MGDAWLNFWVALLSCVEPGRFSSDFLPRGRCSLYAVRRGSERLHSRMRRQRMLWLEAAGS